MTPLFGLKLLSLFSHKMENKQFYIKYLTNQPIKVETHYIGEQDRRRPLTDVGDLVAAYKTVVAPLLDTSSLTLHSIGNELETNYNSHCAWRKWKTWNEPTHH